MCGIAGTIGRDNISSARIQETLGLMKNRGPDTQASFTTEQAGLSVHLLHSRLGIIDLDPRSNQPFTLQNCTLIFNGEIYNYVEVKKLLEQKGVQFFTTSDTEVLLQAYLVFGESCVDYFEGMWSFAIYDARKHRLLLSRDRFAEKPLYYHVSPQGIYFGSEVKFLKALSGQAFRVNQQQALRYLVNGYKSLYKTKDTFFEGVEELPPATNAVIDERLNIEFHSYWQPTHRPVKMTTAQAIEGTRHHLLESLRIRLRSDVPLAFCLSGGIDSASIVSIAAKEFQHDVTTFSIIETDERYNEYDNIMATVRDTGCKYNLLSIPQAEGLPRLKSLIEYHDAPIATTTYYVHSLISEAVAKSGCRVAFSGTAADELFTGYYDHFLLHLYEVRNHKDYQKYLADWTQHIKGFVRNPLLQDPEAYVKNPKARDHIYYKNDEYAEYLKVPFNDAFTETQYTDSLLRNRMLNELFHEATRLILHEDDLNSMKYSVENRSPYLDSKLFEFAYSIPSPLLIQNGYGKYLLREAMKGILNDEVRLDRKKKGFNASITSLLDLQDADNQAYLLDPKAAIFELVDRSKFAKLFDREQLPNSDSKFLFNFINLRIFLEQNS